MIQGSPTIQQLSLLAVDVNIDCLREWKIGSRLVIIGMILHSFKVQTPVGLIEAVASEREKSSGSVSLAASLLRLRLSALQN